MSNGQKETSNSPALEKNIPEKHPRGLWVLFITEMWERFSYYGMRALFVLFLIASVDEILPVDKNNTTPGLPNTNPGFGWSEGDAYALYAAYTFMVYFTSILGGIVADRFLGTHKSMIIGGWIIALGHICLAGMALFPHDLGAAVSLDQSGGVLLCFLVGCSLIIIGTGYFKPCVSVMVGQLYRDKDPRRDSGFTIFYMGINLGAFLSPLVAGSLASYIGWHWGFGSAAVGMILGLIFYQFLRPKYLEGIGQPPPETTRAASKGVAIGVSAALIAVPLLPLLLLITGGLDPIIAGWGVFTSTLGVWGMAGLIIGIIVISSSVFLGMQNQEERGPLGVILILAFIGNIFFWTAFEQAGSSMNVFAERYTDRTLFGLLDGTGFPASWYQSANALTILLFAPVFAWLWLRLERMKKDPSTPLKFAIGLWLLGLSFLAMVLGSLDIADGGLAGPYWLLITYVVYTWGELCLSPVGLSMVTKLAPKRLQSLMMGLWFFTFALASLSAGLVARFSTRFVGEDADLTFLIPGLPGFYLMLVIFPVGAGFLIFLLTPMIKRMMHGIE